MKEVFSSTMEKILLSIPWPEVASTAWIYVKRIFNGLIHEGMYEVLEMESTLELLNKKGTRAIFTKRKHVRFLQNETIAFQDYAWGDGKILLDYKCAPGKVVDKYRQGFKTYMLISLGETKSRGEEEEFHSQWLIQGGFLVPEGFWETDISEKTKRIKVNVIFPRTRIPKKVEVVETNQKRTIEIPLESFELLGSGGVKISWEKENPRLYENYILKWLW